MDRIAPTRRPTRSAVGYQRWRDLLFVHWALPPSVVRPLLPEPLELDLWEGSCFLGIVPFRMRSVRPSWWPRVAGINFLETNVRTYVSYRGRPGVYFFSLDANHLPAVWAARLGWGLPYYYARIYLEQQGTRFRAGLERRGAAGCDFVYETGEPLGPSQPESLEFFLLERYLLFVAGRGGILTGQVHHQPYPAYRAQVHESRESLLAAAGLPAANGLPLYAHYSTGVDVEVFGLER